MKLEKRLRNLVNRCDHLTVILMKNKKNPNKFLEIHRSDCRHTTVRQFMRWYDTKTEKDIINYNGDGCLHRIRNSNLEELLTDYRIEFIYRKGK